MSDAFFAIDRDWTITMVNAHHVKTTKVSREAQIGKNLLELFFPDPAFEDSIFLRSYRRAMTERVFIHFEDHYAPLDLWTEVRVYPQADGGLAIFFTDIGERKRNELALALERHKLDVLVSESALAIGLMRGENLTFEIVNRRWTELVSPREYVGRRYVDVYPELVGTETHRSVIDVFETGVPFVAHEMEIMIAAPDGRLEPQYFDYTNIRVLGSDGKPYGVYCNSVNVTARVRARARLEAVTAKVDLEAKRADGERAKFEAAFQAVADGIFIFDSNGAPVFMNDAAAKVFGSASAADVRRRFEYYFERLDLYELDGTFIPLTEWPVARVLRGESFRDWQIKAHRTDIDAHFTWSSSGELARQPGSDTTLAVVVLRDISDQKRIERDLLTAKLEADRAKDEAEAANELKSAFLANMSHEIRTPLGAMLGFTDLMKDHDATREELDSYLEVLTRNGEQLSVIIDDILDLSKVEAGHLNLELMPVDLEKIAREIVSFLGVRASAKNLELKYVCESSTPGAFTSDPVRVRQVLLNLITNALKFTSSGSITLRSYGYLANDQTLAAAFEVTDTGIGIPAEQRERIFEVFVQGDGSMTRRFGGTGLGLALSRKLARALGGDLRLTRTESGRGSTFLFTCDDLSEGGARGLGSRLL